MLVGKTGGGPSCKQDEINALMISLAKAGKRVVRLKGGDPDDLRPRRRGDRSLPRRRHRGRGRARHQRGAGRGEPARRLAHPPQAGAARAISSPRTATSGQLPRRHRLGEPRRRRDHDRGLHAQAHAGRTCRHARIAHGLAPDTPALAVVVGDAPRAGRHRAARSPTSPSASHEAAPDRPGAGDDRPRAGEAAAIDAATSDDRTIGGGRRTEQACMTANASLPADSRLLDGRI